MKLFAETFSQGIKLLAITTLVNILLTYHGLLNQPQFCQSLSDHKSTCLSIGLETSALPNKPTVYLDEQQLRGWLESSSLKFAFIGEATTPDGYKCCQMGGLI